MKKIAFLHSNFTFADKSYVYCWDDGTDKLFEKRAPNLMYGVVAIIRFKHYKDTPL